MSGTAFRIGKVEGQIKELNSRIAKVNPCHESGSGRFCSTGGSGGGGGGSHQPGGAGGFRGRTDATTVGGIPLKKKGESVSNSQLATRKKALTGDLLRLEDKGFRQELKKPGNFERTTLATGHVQIQHKGFTTDGTSKWSSYSELTRTANKPLSQAFRAQEIR